MLNSTSWLESREFKKGVKIRFLVTGAAGFLGLHLSDRLVATFHDVLAVDNFFTGDKHNLKHLVGSNKVEMVRHDVTFPLFVG